MNGTSTYGTVTDYATGNAIRPAMSAEWRKTAGKLASGDSDAYTGAWADGDGRAVYVDGGPDAEVTDEDIADLEQAAANAGDGEQVTLCREALDGDAGARAECARVILDTRTEFAADA